MMAPLERTIQIRFQQKVCFTRDVFALSNPLLNDVLRSGESGPTSKAMLVLDESLHRAQPALARQIESYFVRF